MASVPSRTPSKVLALVARSIGIDQFEDPQIPEPMVQTRSRTRVALTLLPQMSLLTSSPCPALPSKVRDGGCVSKLFAHNLKVNWSPCGHSWSRHCDSGALQTGVSVPKVLPAESWWRWPSLKYKLFPMNAAGAACGCYPTFLRPGRIFAAASSSMEVRQAPPDEIVLGRMTRAFDNRQGIQDPRVSRQHLRISLLNDFEPRSGRGRAS